MAVQSLNTLDAEIPPAAPPPDTDTACLAIVMAVHRKPIDLVRLAHAMGRPGQPLTTADLAARPGRLCTGLAAATGA